MKVIINEQHSLLPEQEKILNSQFENWEFFKVPASGWALEEMKKIARQLAGENVVFCSPIPVLLGELSKIAGFQEACSRVEPGYSGSVPRVYVFHNDAREKKELPNGKTITTRQEKVKMDYKYLLEKKQPKLDWSEILLLLACLPIGYFTIVMFFCL